MSRRKCGSLNEVVRVIVGMSRRDHKTLRFYPLYRDFCTKASDKEDFLFKLNDDET